MKRLFPFVCGIVLFCNSLLFAEKVTIQSEPPAILWINGNPSKQTPVELNLVAGKYRLQLRQRGYKKWTSLLLVPKNASLSLVVTLESFRSKRKWNADPLAQKKKESLLFLQSTPNGADVFVNGFSKGKTPILLKLSKGYQSIELKKEGFAKTQNIVQIGEGITRKNIPLSLVSAKADSLLPADENTKPNLDKKTPEESSQLFVYSNPKGKVYIDGNYLGETPSISVGLTAGTHQIIIKKKGYFSYKRIVLLVPGKTIRIKALLVPRSR